MKANRLSPELQLAVELIAEGRTFPAYLCSDIPRDVEDIARVSLGIGQIKSGGGFVKVNRSGTAVCLAYNVEDRLVITKPSMLPLPMVRGTTATIGALTTPNMTRQ